MKATVDAKNFGGALKKAHEAAMKSSIPFLEQVCVSVSDGVCRLTGTNLRQWICAEIPADGDDFSFVFSNTKDMIRICKHFDGKLAMELFIKELPGGKSKDITVELTCGGKAASFPAYESDGLHDLPELGDAVQAYQVNAAALLARIKRVSYAASDLPSHIADKPALCGVRFQDNRVWCVDGARMAINQDNTLMVEQPFILPAHTLTHLKEFGKADAKLSVGAKYAAFTGESVSLYSRILEPGDSLKIENVLPKTYNAIYEVNRKQYLDQVKYLCECVRNPKKAAVLFDNGRLLVFENDMVFRAAVDVIGECDDQHSLKLDFLKEALEQFSDAEYVTLKTNHARTSPVVITAGGADTAFILPMRAANGWDRLEAAA